MNDERLDRYLNTLPSALPPPALGARILARHRQRRRQRWLALAAGLALLLGAGVLLRPGAPTPARVAASGTVPGPALAEIRALDRELQLAYADGADRRQLDPLWQARQRALARLNDPTVAPSRPVRL